MTNFASADSNFLKLDRIANSEFLLSAASVFLEKKLISNRESDQLRIAISAQQSKAQGSQSLVTELIDQNIEFISILANRFGSRGLISNLFRHSSQQVLLDISETMRNFGKRLIEKSDLFFNKPFFIYEQKLLSREVLFSDVLVSLAEVVEQSWAGFERARTDLLFFQESLLYGYSEEHQTIDVTFADAIGMTHPKGTNFAFLADSFALGELTKSCELLTKSALFFLDKISVQVRKDELITDAIIMCDWLNAQSDHFKNFMKLDPASPLRLLELQRMQLMVTLGNIKEISGKLCTSVLDLLKISVLNAEISLTFDQDDGKQRLLRQSLVARGLAYPKAAAAIDALSAYVGKNGCDPATLLENELTRVHKDFPSNFIEALQGTEVSKSNESLGRSKKQIFERGRAIARAFDRNATIAMMILCISVTFFACGLKTNPMSDVEELRPELPFVEADEEDGDAGPKNYENKIESKELKDTKP